MSKILHTSRKYTDNSTLLVALVLCRGNMWLICTYCICLNLCLGEKCNVSSNTDVGRLLDETGSHKHLHTFFGRNQPLWWFRGLGGAHVILCIDSELVFSARHYVASCESIVEDVICNGMPCSFTWIPLSHHIVQSVVTFLIWRWGPWNGHCARHVFVNLHRTWWLRLIWSSNTEDFFLFSYSIWNGRNSIIQ